MSKFISILLRSIYYDFFIKKINNQGIDTIYIKYNKKEKNIFINVSIYIF